MAEVTHIKDLLPDKLNARRHGSRNIGMIGDSLQEVGAARSIVISEDDTVLCGNGLIEAAAERGITKVQVVEADGNTIIAVRRRGLTAEQKVRLALFDNMTATHAEWNIDVLKQLAAADVDLSNLWTDAELAKLFTEDDEPDPAASQASCCCPTCGTEHKPK